MKMGRKRAPILEDERRETLKRLAWKLEQDKQTMGKDGQGRMITIQVVKETDPRKSAVLAVKWFLARKKYERRKKNRMGENRRTK